MRTTLLGGIAIVVLAGGCAAMHKQTIENMKANGDPRAPCYEACGASDVVCMKECDNKHPFAGTILQGAGSGGGGGGGGGSPAATDSTAQPPSNGVTQEQIEMLTAAALQDAARKKAASTPTPSSSTPSSSTSSSSSTTSSSFTSSRSTSRAPSSNLDCNPACGPGQKCAVYLQGSKQCAPGGKCWTVDRTHAECK